MSISPLHEQSRTRVDFGIDAIDRLGEAARSLGCQRALIASDPGIIAVGHTQRGLDSLAGAGLQTCVFDGVRENPTTEHVEQGLKVAREFQPDLLVGLGGGSSMDCAKGINFLYSCGGKMQDYWGVGKATGAMLPMIAVPTTAGTGSETQSFALISDADTHVKMACGDKRAAFAIAILDPQLTLTQPHQVTVLTAIDAISHAIETYVTKRRNPVSQSLSREAWRLLSGDFENVLENPGNLQARSSMQLGASFSGLAIENSMLGAAHALANPLTAEFGLVHGQAVGIMLPWVVAYNAETMSEDFLQLEAIANQSLGDKMPLVARLRRFLKQSGLHENLSQCGVPQQALPRLADAASTQWTGTFNPRDVDTSSLLKLYESAYS